MESKRWLNTLQQAIASCYFLLGMEWLFFATKPSFLSNATDLEAAGVLLTSPLLLAVWIIAAIGALYALAAIIPLRLIRWTLHNVARIVPAMLLTAAALLLVDNFTYTVFGWGVVSSEGRTSVVYIFLLGLCFLITYRFLVRQEVRNSLHPSKLLPSLCSALVLLSSISLASGMLLRESSSAEAGTVDRQAPSLPSIFLLGADALSSSHLSAYGYQRDTTPALSKFAEHAVFFENVFPNCGTTGCSFASMLTGKLPTETKLIYPPDILSGEDSFRHLPGVLRQLGYKNAAITIRHYGDPFDLNMRESFDHANGRSPTSQRASIFPSFLGRKFNSEEYFLNQVATRIFDRALHLLGVRPMADVFQQVGGTARFHGGDKTRFDEFIRFLEANPDPVFVHLHFLGTHGPKFHPERQVFSVGKKQPSRWMSDFYDDAIADVDRYFGEILDYLRRHDRYRNSFIAILSDHGRLTAKDERIPLVIKFPHQTEPTRVSQNVQLLDLAPTILDTLDIQIPSYMHGSSLRTPELDPLRPIFTVQRTRAYLRRVKHWWSEKRAGPRAKDLHINMISCDRKYHLDSDQNKLVELPVSGHTAPCDNDRLLKAEDALQRIKTHLSERGYFPAGGGG